MTRAAIGTLLAGVALGITACPMTRCRPYTPSLPALDPTTIDDGLRSAAMRTVHAFAIWPNGEFPPELSLMPIARAVQVLRSDGSAFAASRRRRAIARLATFALATPSLETPLRDLLAGLPICLESLRVAIAAAPEFVRSDEVLLESYIADLPMVTAQLQVAGCQWKKLYQYVDTVGPVVKVVVRVRVKRGLKGVARGIDPQTWDCCSKFWRCPENTFLVKKPAADWIEIPPKPVGTTYGPEFLRERFTCLDKKCKFDTVLGVGAQRNPKGGLFNTPGASYDVWYWLKEAISGQGPDGLPVTLTRDDGGIKAVKIDPDWVRLRSTKTLQLSDPAATAMLEAVISQYELGGELAEMACCGMGTEPCGNGQPPPPPCP
jgi:hypothetical protein